MHEIIIGTRGSQLSLKQTDIVVQQLQRILPDTTISIKTIVTHGDKNMNPVPLDTIGKGWFTKEIDRELLEESIDLAVHSLKDLPEILPKGLIIGAILEREDAREALVANSNFILATLPSDTIIGTDSSRRKATILNKRSDMVVKSVRGNINKRIEKLDNQEYGALLLAVAGLKRLGMTNRITQYFDITDFIPSPGQGALAVVIRKNNIKLNKGIQRLNHTPTVQAVKSERVFSKTIGGGCKMPVGAYAQCIGSMLTLYGAVGTLDGKYLLKDSEKGDMQEAAIIGKKLAMRMLEKSKPWYKKNFEI